MDASHHMITMLRATATATAAAQLLRAHLVAAGSCSLTPPTPQTPLALEPSSSRGVTAARVSEHASNKPHSLPLLLVASWLHPCLQHLPPTPPPHAAASGNGADINVPREEDNRTPLHIAVNEGHEDVVEALLAAGGGQEGGRAGLKAAAVEQGVVVVLAAGVEDRCTDTCTRLTAAAAADNRSSRSKSR